MKRKPKAFLESVQVWNEHLNRFMNEWYDDFVYISRNQLINLGYEIIPFDGLKPLESFKTHHIDPKIDVIFGSVESTYAWFHLTGVTPPTNLSYPRELIKFLGRSIEKTTFKDIGNDYPYFLKPAEGVKTFTGDVVSKDLHLDFVKSDIEVSLKDCILSFGEKKQMIDSTPVFKSEIIDFVSEYRCFVREGNLKGIKWYKGDFKVFPDVSRIEEMVLEYTSAPIAYTLDVGVDKNGQTLLVEVNDMWAIGSYGMDDREYVLMCVRRLKEIVNYGLK